MYMLQHVDSGDKPLQSRFCKVRGGKYMGTLSVKDKGGAKKDRRKGRGGRR